MSIKVPLKKGGIFYPAPAGVFSVPTFGARLRGIVSPALAPRVKFPGEGSTPPAGGGRGVNQIDVKPMDTPLYFTALTLRVQKMSPLLGENFSWSFNKDLESNSGYNVRWCFQGTDTDPFSNPRPHKIFWRRAFTNFLFFWFCRKRGQGCKPNYRWI